MFETKLFLPPAYDGIVSALKQAGSATEVTFSEGTRGLFLPINMSLLISELLFLSPP